ncbi:MAG: DUF4350 domain-containing protein [Sedimenticola sp.]|nr:DUF4350 domain-containing protein [Sedimenticola sp.]
MANRAVLSLLALLLLALAGWGVSWFLENYEQRTREIRADVSPMAKRNPFLAAERFLQHIGIPSESVTGRDHLLNPPQQPGLLLVNRLGPDLPPEREQALRNWVVFGGHLVVVAQGEWDEESGSSGNRLLDRLGVQPVALESLDEDESAARLAARESDEPITFSLPGSDEQLSVAFSRKRVLHDSRGRAEWWVESVLGAHLLQFRMGDGYITVLGDNGFLRNGQIGDHDHALFLARLAEGQPRTWLLYSSNMPSLPQLLWQYAGELVLSLLCLVLLAVWRMTRRSGPLLPEGGSVRRNLLQHLSAVGHYIWRNDHAGTRFRYTQETLEQAWRRRHPVLETLDSSARCEWIARHTGISERAVREALYGEMNGEQGLVRLSAVQQRLAARLRNH